MQLTLIRGGRVIVLGICAADWRPTRQWLSPSW